MWTFGPVLPFTGFYGTLTMLPGNDATTTTKLVWFHCAGTAEIGGPDQAEAVLREDLALGEDRCRPRDKMIPAVVPHYLP